MHIPQSVSCVEVGSPARRRLSGTEAVVIVVIVNLAAVLAAVAGLPVLTVVELLLGAGLAAVLMIKLAAATPVPAARTVLRALSGPAL
ncbi:hypothetical protein [Streptomyces stelliscabiei]|uniref:hypothetical protein n=1 Tax=Streptomyces stelliscabiei TaxID=146820 RepID=UPI0029B79439|nr:hypothetical protein [Streptomyces stelliscabiei]MDX2557654.1 hypothetical protein [Streptomyces stelliscabiei]MDX2617093.1 hypothetical protein [Streptomyces stelliscabiei]MDX2641467.1 hypothetical protein [Streptomyces stelliscabiei]MDX2666483.1 hypothetical protein [Streptomyces stelliscabiei]MDX2717320.1 hypothetical protein [Streptomyces stelliscabiei]